MIYKAKGRCVPTRDSYPCGHKLDGICYCPNSKELGYIVEHPRKYCDSFREFQMTIDEVDYGTTNNQPIPD